MSTQIHRIAQIMQYLPTYPRFLTQKQIAEIMQDEGFQNDIMTYTRDVNKLSTAFAGRIGVEDYREYNKRTGREMPGDHSRHVFWYPAKKIDLANLNVHEALGLGILKRFAGPFLPSKTYEHLEPLMDESEKLLQNLPNHPFEKWMKKLLESNASYTIPPIQETISNALLEDYDLELVYHCDDEQDISFRVSPSTLVMQANSYHLLARELSTQEKRLFDLTKIVKASRLDKNSNKKPLWGEDNIIHRGLLAC